MRQGLFIIEYPSPLLGVISQDLFILAVRGRLEGPQRDPLIIIEYPGLPLGIVSQQFLILFRPASHTPPYDPRLIDIGVIVHPLVVNIMMRTVSNEDEELAGLLIQARVDALAFRNEEPACKIEAKPG